MIRPLAGFSAHLSDAAILIGAEPLAEDLIFTGVTHSDKDVEAGDLFLAISGTKVHGAEFIKNARAKGAVGVITDAQGAQIDSSLPTLVVNDVRAAGAHVARLRVGRGKAHRPWISVYWRDYACILRRGRCVNDRPEVGHASCALDTCCAAL